MYVFEDGKPKTPFSKFASQEKEQGDSAQTQSDGGNRMGINIII